MRLKENKHSLEKDYMWTLEISDVLTREKWVQNDDDDIVLFNGAHKQFFIGQLIRHYYYLGNKYIAKHIHKISMKLILLWEILNLHQIILRSSATGTL